MERLGIEPAEIKFKTCASDRHHRRSFKRGDVLQLRAKAVKGQAETGPFIWHWRLTNFSVKRSLSPMARNWSAGFLRLHAVKVAGSRLRWDDRPVFGRIGIDVRCLDQAKTIEIRPFPRPSSGVM